MGADCGAKVTDARWEAAQATDWGTPRDFHPQLCDDCKRQAQAQADAVLQAPAANELQDQAVPEQRTGRWFSRHTCPGQAPAHRGEGPRPAWASLSAIASGKPEVIDELSGRRGERAVMLMSR